MVSFRYYLVTIVAIFLALGLGVLAGTTVLDESLVQGLENRTEQLQGNLEELRDQVTGLQLENDGLNQLAEDVTSLVAPGRLTGEQVIIVTQEDVDGSARAQALEAMESAGADRLAVIIVRREMAALESAERERLAEILGLPATTAPETLSREAARQLAQRLGEGSQRPGDLRPDLLEDLVAGDFIEADAPALADGSASELGGPDAVVVVGGGEVELAPPPRDFLLPLTEELVRGDTSVAAGQSLATTYPFVESIRSPEGFGDGRPMVSVDNVDQPTGKLALILGLERLLGLGEGGHYGLGGNVDGVIPPLDVAA